MNVIDIGSNSVRLLSNGKKTVITTRLAENMTNGLLNEISIKRTVDGILTLANSVTDKCYVFATEAVRSASNQQLFLEQVKLATGLTVDVISGDTEAEISYLGATDGYNSDAVVIDLGGASCEIIFGKCGKIQYKRSFPFGCVKLYNLFGSDLNKIRNHVTKTLDELPALAASKYIAVGGTVTSLAAMAQNLCVYDTNKVHGYVLTLDDVRRTTKDLLDGKEFATLSSMRKKSILQGAAALFSIMKRLEITNIEISEKDNLEGYCLRLA